MKKHLAATPQATSRVALQTHLDIFTTYYNEIRPHRARQRMTPRAAFDARVKAGPRGTPVRDAGEFRIRYDRVDQWGKVTLRYAGKLRHLSIGRAHKGQHILMLVDDRDVRVLSTEGAFITKLRIDPDRTYQAQAT
jgi:hypothetical protein